MTWKPPYCTADDLDSWLSGGDPAELALAAEAASRAIDRATGRQFGITEGPEAGHYRAEYHRGTTYVKIDDTFDTDLTVAGVDSVTLYPRNPKGKPWTQLRIAGYVGDEVTVTATWGWTAVPDAIKLATLIQAARLYERRTNTAGPLSSEKVDDVAYGYGATTELDADVAASIAPYRKLWAAA